MLEPRHCGAFTVKSRPTPLQNSAEPELQAHLELAERSCRFSCPTSRHPGAVRWQMLSPPLQILPVMVAGWVNRRQLAVLQRSSGAYGSGSSIEYSASGCSVRCARNRTVLAAARPNLTLIRPRTAFKTHVAYAGSASVSPDDVFARNKGQG